MTGPDLKPCPFCGGNNVRAFRHVPMQPDPCVMCRDCYASAVSVAKWNRRDPAIIAALPEVQALIAAAYEVAASVVDTCNAEGPYQSIGAAGRIRALTPSEAIAALAARDAAMIARGMREAAGIAWALEDGDRWTRAAAQKAILARAEQIEKGAPE